MLRCLPAALPLLIAAWPALAAGGPVVDHRGAATAAPPVPIYRGQAAPPAYLAAPGTPTPPQAPVRLLAGEQLWRVGPDGGTVCRLRNTADVGRSVVRCTPLPAAAFARD